MNIKMIGNNVLVADTKTDSVTTGGIILTGDTTKGTKPGVVLAVGGDVTTVSVGDKVYINWAKGLPVDYEGKGAAIVDIAEIKGALLS